MRSGRFRKIVWTVFIALMLFPGSASAGVRRLTGQTLYVPVYSHIYGGDKQQLFHLTVTLSVRNTDLSSPVTLRTVDYYDTDGNPVTRYLSKPIVLPPMGSIRYVVSESDKRGGSGANFIVIWDSEKPVSPLMAETVMIGTKMQQGISFTSRGIAIDEKSDRP